ncbi:uncharacterized protein LOC119671473 [Teleopsis dalmanni]|uniref:uncharacterized protein LOC119671473 n=1 Tax=Teleopsis dalmanni TaxID=139649 RepID=UPI0018CE910B|nr:uncharacterized protein LOC119671473 [Teleopsis dalmanni]
MIGNCIGNCGHVGPPPDSILSMPPPPLPSFLLPKTAVLALPTENDSQPCFTPFMCESNAHPRESGVEFVELTGGNNNGLENTWLFVLISSCVGVLILGGLLAVILLKCRDTLFASCNFSYHDSNIKQGAMNTLGEPSKSNPFMAGGILYPCTAAASRDTLQSQMANDSRLLWATLTPHGTRHFITDYPSVNNAQEGHYEVVDYRSKPQNHIYRDYAKRTPIKSFDNSGFVDYDYEDPTPLMESYHDDLDSGYQEPQEILNSLQRSSPRPLVVSSPTRIDNPNIAPLNYYPSSRTNTLQSNHSTTLNRKATSNRRISDASTYGGPNM